MLAGVLLCSICGHVRVRSNRALPEGIPLGQADGMSRGTLNIAWGGFSFVKFVLSFSSVLFLLILFCE